jgi:hypothetical protein
MEKQGDEIKAYCNVCAGERDHEVLFAVMREWHEDDGSYDEFEQCLVAACCGCKHRIFLKRWQNSPQVEVTQYPPKTIRKTPDWLFNLFLSNTANSTKNELITEIYAALGANCTRLAVLGIRALLEHIMIEKIGDQGSFENNLAAFQADGFISSVQQSAMSPVIQAGHASMHRAYNPPLDDVMHCLDVTENLILAIYIHPNRSAQMYIPERAKLAKKVKARS